MQAAPTTMDQVVSLFIEREHGLIKMLGSRTPVVETYLQNLTADPVLGAVPSEDHYFLGRMDMGATVDRKDYLKEEEKSMQQRLMGGFRSCTKFSISRWGFPGWSTRIGTDSTGSTTISAMRDASSSGMSVAWYSM